MSHPPPLPVDPEQVKTLFAEALDRESPAERARFLDRACGPDLELRGAVDSLLEAHAEGGGFLDKVLPPPAPAQVGEEIGSHIGPYELRRKIGEGGFGVVYEASQHSPIRRTLALKIIKPGMDTRVVIARFEAERQALALMDHPNIARVFDAGTTEAGRPYFVMEHVDGLPITEHCNAARLTVRDRLELLLQVGRAVQHAHQKGIIHRDLKPSNVLVTSEDGEAVPKVIDFGVAKALEDPLTGHTAVTLHGQLLGTPQYMSPEQTALNGLDVDTRSDVFALGALLYELLTGTTPIEAETLRTAAYDEVCRMIREEDPPRPSARLGQLGKRVQDVARERRASPAELRHQLARDLDWIVMKALEKERARRYESANGLVMDLERFLGNECVSARPPSQAYRFRKAVARNRPLAIAGMAMAGMLIAGVLVSSWQARRAREAETVAVGALARLESAREEEAFRRGDYPKALALLAHRLHRQPEDATAGQRLFSALSTGRLLVPTGPALAHGDDVVDVRFSPDERKIVTCSLDGTARVWDAETGATLTPPLRHDDRVWMAAFDPSGERVVTASHDGTARVWSVKDGRPLTKPLRHGPAGPGSRANSVWAARFSPDGHLLATASNNGLAFLWDAATGERTIEALRHDSSVNDVVFSPDGGHIATVSDDRTARIWDTTTGRELMRLSGHEGEVVAVRFSPDGTRLATASYDGTARLWDARSGEPVGVPMVHLDRVGWVAFSPDGSRVATGSYDRTARLWDASTGWPVTPALAHGDMVRRVRFSPDCNLIATASWDRSVRVWDARTGDAIAQSTASEGMREARFSRDGRRLLTASADRTAQVWRFSEPFSPPHRLPHADRPLMVCFSPDGSLLATATRDGSVGLWDAIMGKQTRAEARHQGPVVAVSFSSIGSRLLSASHDGTARIIDPCEDAATTIVLDHGGVIRCAVFSTDERHALTAGDDGLVRVWDATTGTEASPALHHPARVRQAAFSSDGSLIATACDDAVGRLWHRADASVITRLQGHTDMLGQIVFSPGGDLILTGGADGTARIWHVDSGQLHAPPLGHAAAVSSLAFSPDGHKVLTASSDHTARFWDASSGEPLGPPMKHQAEVTAAVFSPDGRWIVTSSRDHTSRLWDVETAEPITPPLQQADSVITACFSPDSKQVATTSVDGTVAVWKLPPASFPRPELLARLAEAVAGHQVALDGGLSPLPIDEIRSRLESLLQKAGEDPCGRLIRHLAAP